MMRCSVCGEKASEGSAKQPYCVDCWNRLWGGKEDQYFDWLLYRNTPKGRLLYKKKIEKMEVEKK